MKEKYCSGWKFTIVYDQTNRPTVQSSAPASIALLTGDASVHATNRTYMCRHASTDATHLTCKHVMTCKHVEIWLSLEFMTVAKSDFLLWLSLNLMRLVLLSSPQRVFKLVVRYQIELLYKFGR